MRNKKYYERAAEILQYEPETGRLTRGVRTAQSVQTGDEAGSINQHGYRDVGITIDGKFNKLITHRIIWFIHHGEVPKILDHVDGDPLNNRIENLRPATSSQNNKNRRSRKNSSSTFLGVSWNKRGKKWSAGIAINGKKKHLGYFNDEIEAALAYDSAAREHHGEFANPNFT